MPVPAVDLDHGDVCAERERGALLVEVELAVELLADLGRLRRQIAPGECLGGHTGHADRAGGGVDDDVGFVGLQQPRSELLGLGHHCFGCAAHGGAAELQRPRPAGAAAGAHTVGVAVDQRDVLDRDAGLVGDQHRVGGLVALPVRLRAGVDRHRAVVVHLDRPELVAAAAGGDLDVGGHTDAEQRLVAGLAPTGLLGAQLVVADRFGRPIEREVVAARVVGVAGQRAEREHVVAEEVAAPDLDRVDAQLERCLVDEPLQQRGRLRPTSATVGAHRCGVGDGDGNVELDRRERVGALRHSSRAARQERADAG